jgi:Apea-like HEPN
LSLELPLSKYKANIALALNWYLEAMAAEEIESKFLNLSTALECLMDGYHKANNSEFILTESEFSIVENKMIPEIKKILNQIGMIEGNNQETFKTVKSSLQQLKRRTYINKFIILLDQMKIGYSDVNLNPRKIVNIRNDITHRGQLAYINDQIKFDEIYSEQYKPFWSVLIRIFLKLLSYSGDYFDPFHKSLYRI